MIGGEDVFLVLNPVGRPVVECHTYTDRGPLLVVRTQGAHVAVEVEDTPIEDARAFAQDLLSAAVVFTDALRVALDEGGSGVGPWPSARGMTVEALRNGEEASGASTFNAKRDRAGLVARFRHGSGDSGGDAA